MIKYLLIFIIGIIETYIYAGYLIAVNKCQARQSSILYFINMTLHVGVIAWAIKDVNTILMIIIYNLSCAIGNYLRIKKEKKINKILEKLI